MTRVSLTLLALTLAALPLPAQSKADMDARAAIAMCSVRTNASVPVARPQSAVSYLDALAYTHLTHRPVMVSVKTDCSSLCSTIRTEIPAAHVAQLAGDATPHLRLLCAGADGTVWASAKWKSLPSEAEVRAAAHKLDKWAIANPVLPTAKVEPRSVLPNIGSCRCGEGQCHCLPASKCPEQCPVPPTEPVSTQTYSPTCSDGTAAWGTRRR